jgi:hypothetical protein
MCSLSQCTNCNMIIFFHLTDDPVSQTIGEVTQLSNGAYTLDRVTACVHRMWDFGMQYDNIDAVLKELKKEVLYAL